VNLLPVLLAACGFVCCSPTRLSHLMRRCTALREPAARAPRCLRFCVLQSHPPQPSDEEVYIESRPALEVYVSSFGGWATGATYLTHAAELTEVGGFVCCCACGLL
jgi:hypothetical protein